jgi:hypothetical protein
MCVYLLCEILKSSTNSHAHGSEGYSLIYQNQLNLLETYVIL